MLTLTIDRLINALKWPAAILSLLMIPAMGKVFLQQVMVLADMDYALFWGGVLLYVLCHHFLFSKRIWGSFLPTLEHELTHTIFAWITLHRVRGFHASWSKGGHVSYVGGVGNWLITIAPYFFPTFPLLCLLVGEFWPQFFVGRFDLVMGIFIGFQISSTLRETHAKQTDLQKVGFPFAVAILPALNFLSIGWLLAAVAGKRSTMFWSEINDGFFQTIGWLQALL